jgi:hypothetical protein
MARALDVEAVRGELERRTTEELVSILRNRDEDEWQPEVFAVVAALLEARGLSATEVAAQGPEGSDVVEAQELATVGRYFSPVEAHAHRMALEEAGIKAWVLDEDLGTMYGVGVAPRLQVRSADQAMAREVLDSAPAPASAFPADPAATCPACGSKEVTPGDPVPDSPAPQAKPRRSGQNNCGSCGHTWSV